MRIVVDTNAMVSSFLVRMGPPADVMRRVRAKQVDMVVSSAVLAEYGRVLGYGHLRPRHGLDDAEIDAAVAELRDLATVVEPTERLTVVPDGSDNRFLECAIAGHAEFIVSGDRHLLSVGEYQGIRVITPASFVALLDSLDTE